MPDTVSARILCAFLLLGALMVGLAGCATSKGQSLRIDTRQVPAVRYMPDEITSVLEDLGYELIVYPDPVKTVQRYDQIRIRFRARDASNTRIDVHIQLTNQVTGLHLYRVDEQGSTAASAERFRELKERVERQFGAENVSEARRFVTP